MVIDPDVSVSTDLESIRVDQIDSTVGAVSFTQATDANKPLLSERGRRENLLTYTEQIDNAVWKKNETTVSANSVANPVNGATDADLVTESSNSGVSPYVGLVSAYPYIGSVVYRQSVYVKANGRTAFRLYGSNGSYVYSDVNLATETITASTATTSSLDSLGSGWYRFTQTFTPASTATGLSQLYFANPVGTITYNADGTSGMYIWGFQLQRASMSPTYIPTQSLPRHGSLTGRRGLYYDGSNDTMADTSTDVNTILGASAYEMFAVVKDEDNTSTSQILGDTGGYVFIRHQTSNNFQLINYGGGEGVLATNPTALAPAVLNAYYDGTNIGIGINGGTYSTTASTDLGVAAGTLTLGNTGQGHRIYNLSTYDKVLPASVRQRLMQRFKRVYRVN